MKNYLISLLILLMCVPSQAMLVRAAQPVAKRIISRLLAPKAQKVAQRTLQLPTRTAPQPVLRSAQTKLFKARPYYRSYYKPTWLLSAGAGTLYASTLRNRAYAEPIQPKPWATVEEQYRTWFKQTEAQYMQELFELCNITEKEWQEYVKKAEEDYISQEALAMIGIVLRKINGQIAPLSDHVEAKTKQLLEQHIPKETVFVLPYPNTNTMASGMTAILINEKECRTLTKEAFEAAVLHEIQHILHKDIIHKLARKRLLKDKCDKSFTKKDRTEILKAIERFEEKRADILGALAAGLEHTQSFSSYFCKNAASEISLFKLHNIDVKDYGKYASGTHPLNYTRCTYLDKLYKQMLLTQYPTLHTP